MATPPAEPIMATLRDAVDRQAFGYPLPDAASGLPEVASTWLAGQGLTVPAEQIRPMPDVIKGMVLAIKHLTPPGTPVAVITPTYSRFRDAVAAAERAIIEVPMQRYGHRYAPDLGAVERALRDGARTVLLCNPSNPVGRVFSPAELNQLAELVESYGARTISDEIHAPLTYETGFTPYASLSPAAAAHSITLTSASKAWNIPGLRCAVVVLTNPADTPVWDGLPRAAKGGISPLGIEATITAFQHGAPWLATVMGLLDTNRRLLVDRAEAAGLHDIVHLPEATYLAWFDLRRFGLADPRQFLLREAGVATTAGDEHGAGGEGFLRINFASAPDVLEQAVARMATALHWMDHEALRKLIARCGAGLRPGGVFVDGDHVHEGATGRRLDDLARALTTRRARRTGVERTEDWETWWRAVDEAPELAELVRARNGGFAHAVDDRPTVHDYLAFLREAGFAEAGPVWQVGDDRVIVGIR